MRVQRSGGYSIKTHSDNDYSLKTFIGGSGGYGTDHHGSFSSGGGDCCPLVVDPLTYAALLAFLALATYFFNVLIAMSMLMKKRKKRDVDILVEKGKIIIVCINIWSLQSGFLPCTIYRPTYKCPILSTRLD